MKFSIFQTLSYKTERFFIGVDPLEEDNAQYGCFQLSILFVEKDDFSHLHQIKSGFKCVHAFGNQRNIPTPSV